jgi:hypothetical protein
MIEGKRDGHDIGQDLTAIYFFKEDLLRRMCTFHLYLQLLMIAGTVAEVTPNNSVAPGNK